MRTFSRRLLATRRGFGSRFCQSHAVHSTVCESFRVSRRRQPRTVRTRYRQLTWQRNSRLEAGERGALQNN